MIENLTRREVLKRAGGGTIGVTLAGQSVSAQPRDPLDRHIVGTEPGRADVARDAATEVHRVLDFDDIGQAVSGWYTEEALERLRNNPNVRYIEEEGTMEAIGETQPWGIDRVDADIAHSNGETGGDDTDGEGGADVTIIDSGVDYEHRDLDDNYVDGKDFVNDDDDAMDDNGHGTHVAGTADAEDDDQDVIGVCTDANLHAAKVLDSGGSGYWSDVAAGIYWTADQGHDVGNMSLGGSSYSQTVKDACKDAYKKGVLLVAAAGNDGPRPDTVLYPAAYDEVIAVSATNRSDDIARFSSRGEEVELAASGVDILSSQLNGGTTEKSGTSMASPHVAGAGGQLMDNGYSNKEARQHLRDTAEDIGLSSDEQGYGLVDVAAALGLDSGDESAPTVDSLSVDEVETDSEDAEFDASWEVSDDDGDLNGVDLTLYELDNDGNRVEEEDSATEDVGGDSASGTTRLVATGDDGSGNTYEVEAVVSDSNDNTDSAITTVTETEDTDDGTAPDIDYFDLTDTSNRRWARVEVDWTVSDEDGDLAEVTSEAVFANDGTDNETSSISGDSASGTHELRERDGHGEVDVTLTVTDSEDNSTSETKGITLG